MLLSHVAESEHEFNITKREVMKEFREGVTDPARHVADRKAVPTASLRKVIEEQKEI